MIRLRIDAEGRLVAGSARAAGTGRSGYVHEGPRCIDGLVRSKGLVRSLRHAVGKDVRAEIARMLHEKLAARDAKPMHHEQDDRNRQVETGAAIEARRQFVVVTHSTAADGSQQAQDRTAKHGR
jgi:predicted RNA-binding protein YlxR (DUF448 family)